MTRLLLAVTVCLLLVCSCSVGDAAQPAATKPNAADEAQRQTKDELFESARKRNEGKEPSVLDVWNEVVRGAEESAGAVKNLGKPRVVPKGAKPEIIITYDGLITFDGQPLRLGDHIDSWRATLPKNAVCKESKGGILDSTMCDWNSLGISVRGSHERPNIASQMTIYLNFEAVDSSIPDESKVKLGPNETFKGYLEIDGYGVDRHTQFWELRSAADGRRNLRCGLRDCSHPHGGGGGGTSIHIRVDGRSEFGRLREIDFD